VQYVYKEGGCLNVWENSVQHSFGLGNHTNHQMSQLFIVIAVSLLFELPSFSFSQNTLEEIEKSMNTPAQGIDTYSGMYTNPIIFSDYSDPDVIRVGDDFYMVSSSFNCTPALPLLHSKDLVNWTIIGHVAENLPFKEFERPQHGKGCWAPSLRYHNGEFYVYYGDPDFGIFMSKTKNPAGFWEPLVCVREVKGWIDPCPFWDEDGKAFLVHAWAKSRVGFNSVLHVNSMSPDGKHIADDSVMVFDGTKNHPTMEGPKFYKRNGYYYIFAPAGGVAPGWQTVVRAKNILGPYEDKVVLHQGATSVNGPHQGAWIETQKGDSWFIHFQDRGVYGRIIHLQPMWWKNDWPLMGTNQDSSGCGEPVMTWKRPDVGTSSPMRKLQTSDEFDSTSLGLQWQWHANHSHRWYSLSEKKNVLRLKSIPMPSDGMNLWSVPNLLLQKFPAEEFTVTTKLEAHLVRSGEKTGLLIMGFDYSYIALEKKNDGMSIVKNICMQADKETPEIEEISLPYKKNTVYFRVNVKIGGECEFSYSDDGLKYTSLGKPFVAREGRWIGAKAGIFISKPFKSASGGFSDFDWLRIKN
jgi:beta-xylosidase